MFGLTLHIGSARLHIGPARLCFGFFDLHVGELERCVGGLDQPEGFTLWWNIGYKVMPYLVPFILASFDSCVGDLPCVHGGTCDDSSGSPVCTCTGYMGTFCEGERKS